MRRLNAAFVVLTLGILICAAMFGPGARAQSTQVVQSQLVVTGVIPASIVPTQVTVTWPTMFTDQMYSAVCDIEDAMFPGSLQVRTIRAVTAGSVTAVVWNPTGSSSHAGVVHCIAVHP
jgi:hypothetical protein